MTFAQRQARLNAKVLRRFGVAHVVNGVTAQGDFVLPGKTFAFNDGMEMQARVPTLVLADADVPTAPVNKAALCDGLAYTIQEARPDGHGLTVLDLELA
ncbi:hypothetical protein [Polaromonas sp.]|uniref:head-tail joining protein n=1 Tax=Polaromonas sp. TaxID=1869339 RepID=UPI003561D6B0